MTIQYKPIEFLNKTSLRSINKFKSAEENFNRLPVMEIFRSYEGEGSKIGTPRILVRLGGCPIMCQNCDTIHSFNVNKRSMKYQTIDDIVDRVVKVADKNGRIGVREVSITGGEPMMYEERLAELADKLHRLGFKLSLETSGMIINQTTFSHFEFISLDVKAPSTGVAVTKEQLDALYLIKSQHPGVQVKVVISTQDDLDWVSEHLAEFINPLNFASPLILTPNSPYMKQGVQAPSVYANLMEMILDWNEGYNIVVIPQIHKLLQLDPFPEYLAAKTSSI